MLASRNGHGVDCNFTILSGLLLFPPHVDALVLSGQEAKLLLDAVVVTLKFCKCEKNGFSFKSKNKKRTRAISWFSLIGDFASVCDRYHPLLDLFQCLGLKNRVLKN